MAVDLKGRSLLTLKDWSAAEIRSVLDLSRRVKRERRAGRVAQRLRGRTLALLFELLRTLNKYADQHLEEPASRTESALASYQRGVVTLRELTAILGVFRKPPHAKTGQETDLVGKLLDLLVELRAESRKKKDFGTADRIRNGLAEMGITLEDRKDGTAWRLP